MTSLCDCIATPRRLESLRDFFMSRNGGELAEAWKVLTHSDPEKQDELAAPPAVTDWDAVEFSFNKLFVGPQPPLVPPFASLYLDAEPYVMGPSTLKVRNIYRLLGLQSPLEGSFPDDHISLELDALLAMIRALRNVHSSELAELLDYYLEHHLMLWIPTFCEAVWAHEETHPAIDHAARLLEGCLADVASCRGVTRVSPRSQNSDPIETVEDNAL